MKGGIFGADGLDGESGGQVGCKRDENGSAFEMVNKLLCGDPCRPEVDFTLFLFNLFITRNFLLHYTWIFERVY